MTENDLGNFFHSGGCSVVDVKVQTDRETGKSRGFAHVEVRDVASLEKGLTASGVEFMGRRLNVDVGRPPRKDDRKDDRRGGDRDRGDRDRGGRGDRDRDRAAPRYEQDNTPLERGLKVERRDRPERSDRGDRNKPPRAGEAAPAADAVPAAPERKKIEIKPRSVPVGAAPSASAPPTSYSSIFGGAKPREEKVVEKRALPEPPVEKKLEELKVSPPAPPVIESTASVKAVAADGAKDRKPTKPTWSENRAGRGEGRGEGDRRDAAGRGRGGRGDKTDKEGRPARAPRDPKAKGERKAVAAEDKTKSGKAAVAAVGFALVIICVLCCFSDGVCDVLYICYS